MVESIGMRDMMLSSRGTRRDNCRAGVSLTKETGGYPAVSGRGKRTQYDFLVELYKSVQVKTSERASRRRGSERKG
jgi:hypothetical protein